MEEAAALGLDRDALLRILYCAAAHAAPRRARARALQAGQAARARSTPARATRPPRSAWRRPWRPDDVAAPLHRNLGLHLYRGVEPWRVLCQYMGRVGGTTNGRDSNLRTQDLTRGRGHLRRALAPALDPARRRRRRARVPRARRAARRARLDRRRLLGPRHGARVDELRGRAAPAGRVRDRQQPVRLLHADAPQLRLLVARRARAGLRLRGRGRRRHRRARGLPRGARGDRARALRRRADGARADDAAHGGPRRARRRGLRAARAARALGRARPGASLRGLDARARRARATTSSPRWSAASRTPSATPSHAPRRAPGPIRTRSKMASTPAEEEPARSRSRSRATAPGSTTSCAASSAVFMRGRLPA